jgi:hypothetical protein
VRLVTLAPVVDGALGHLHPGGEAAQDRAVASRRERHPVPARARLEVLEVEPEDVVPLDHVRIALADQARALHEQLGLGEMGPGEHGGEAGGVGDRDRDDPIGFARRVRELEPGPGGDLDVERHPPQVPVGHAEERGAARGQQELVGRIREEAVGRVRGSRALAGGAQAVVPRAQGLRPGGELGEPAVGAVPVERGHLELALQALEEIGIGQEQEGPEGLLGDDHPIRAAGVDRDVALRRAEREQPPGAGVSEEQGIVVERERDRGQLRRPRSRCSSRRAVT